MAVKKKRVLVYCGLITTLELKRMRRQEWDALPFWMGQIRSIGLGSECYLGRRALESQNFGECREPLGNADNQTPILK